jgi:hypothetical protein
MGDERLPAAAELLVFLPRVVPHGFTGGGEVRGLGLRSPPGFEEFFRGWGARPLDVEAMTRALAPYRAEFVGPPPAGSG